MSNVIRRGGIVLKEIGDLVHVWVGLDEFDHPENDPVIMGLHPAHLPNLIAALKAYGHRETR